MSSNVTTSKQFRAPLADRTTQDAQVQNVCAPTKKAIAIAAQSITRTWKHNPYEPLEMYDVDTNNECNNQLVPYNTMQLSPVPSAPLDIPPYVGRVVYVNGRPTVVYDVPSPSVSATPNTTNIVDISFDSTIAPTSQESDAPEADIDCDTEVEEEEEEVITVEFHQRRTMYHSTLDAELGDFVVVEGDRGYDVGRVLERRLRSECDPESIRGPKGVPLDWALRHATVEEIRTCQTDQVVAEEEALNKMRAEVERLRLPMEVKSCEFQFDRQKLSFYFEAREKVMFVPLLKALHREFQCRIWLQQVNRGTPEH